MKNIDLQELHNFAYSWLIEGEQFKEITQEQALFLYDVSVVLNKIQRKSIDIIINDETQRNKYIKNI